MTIFNAEEIGKIMEMMDNQFFQLMDRIDKNNRTNKEIKPPKMPRKEPAKFIHEGMQIEQHRSHVEDLIRKGVA